MSSCRQDCRAWPVWRPLIGVLLATVLIRMFDADRRIAALSYDFTNDIWPLNQAEPWLSIYRYGIQPPIVLGVVGFFVALFGRWLGRWNASLASNTVRRNGLFLALVLVIGSGLVIESGLKSFWGRPRPWQSEEFGGTMKFVPVGEWGSQRFINSSFPSGHAAVAFFMMSPAFIVSPRRTRLRWALLVFGILYGMTMGLVRILQGGHYASDILWAGAIVYFVGACLERLMDLHRDERTVCDSPSPN